MRASSAIALLVAIIFGGLAAFLSREFLLGLATPPAPQKTGTIVVARQPLEFGANLTPDNLREIEWPGIPLEGSFATITDLLKDGRRLTLVSMQKNEPILASKVTGPNQRATLSTLIDEGMRAVSVNVDEVRGVAGFILPGDRVDVVLTREERGGAGAGGAVADVLLQNVKVLGIDQVANERTDKPTLAKAVTLELNLQQSQKVILAQGVGKLSLVLRQAGEGESADARRVTLSDLGLSEAIEAKKTDENDDRFAKLEAQLEEMRKAASAPPPAPITTLAKRDDRVIVNVIRGALKRDEYTVMSETR
ncbi:Flp pilus assembly protein CpaB [Microvirga vignae]|uniref:Flp pilus assembly protein CpaB n=1 Tax=Microvirga vignae TaxID=1225564 RepID=UPI0009FDA161|nr:Flp pilus assembly protein CpaB [Microvirga vignae]